MNTPVSFEIAKLLKEKEYGEPVKMFYELALKSRKDKQDGYGGPFGYKKGELNLQDGFFVNNSNSSDVSNKSWYLCAAPTIAEVVMWLYEKYGIWINANVSAFSINTVTGEGEIFLDYTIYSPEGLYIHEEDENKVFNSPTEAYEAAIKYTLNNLIKV